MNGVLEHFIKLQKTSMQDSVFTKVADLQTYH